MPCHVCNNNLVQVKQQGPSALYDCKQCGNFRISNGDVPRINDEFRPIVSGYIRENQNSNKTLLLTQNLVDTIQQMPTPTIDEKIFKIMRWMEQHTPYPGKTIEGKIGEYPELVAICRAKDINEVGYFIEHLKERKFVSTTASSQNRLTIDGLIFLENQKKKINSDLCFCAMSFSPEHKYIYDGVIEPATKDAGYRIIRVDKDPHNIGIVDKIKTLILQSKFVIADLTGHKHGVYYEAAWADRGEQTVIFTCEESDFDGIHFDVQHLNVLKWSKNNLSLAIEDLKWRIGGTIGIGPNKNNLDI